MRADGGTPGRIVHLWGVTSKEAPARSLAHSLDLGFYSLLFLARALGSEGTGGDVGITVVTSGMQEVSGEGLPAPEKATVLGLCRVVPQEYAKVTCRSVDIEAPDSSSGREDQVDRLLVECIDRTGEPVVAYRRSERWVQAFEPVRLEGREARPGRLRERGVYLITGGLGGIGLELASFLAETVHARLVLVGRSGVPAGEQGSARRKRLEALEEHGAEVLVLSADVADREQMEEALTRAEARFGQVHGVIHAAGVAPGGVIQLKTREMAERVLAAKVTGTLVLEALLRDRRPDFLLLCSSLASILGVPGQSDYGAANAFQDAFARRASADGAPFVLSLNWDTWSESGMAVETDAPEDFRERHRALAATSAGILSAEGREVFARALRQPLPQLLASTVDLEARIALCRSMNVALPTEAHETGPRHHRPDLTADFVAPRDEIERTIAGVWQELLGFERVGVYDDFFDLGGHSLLAMQVVNRLRQTFQVPLRLQSLFDAPTVAQLAAAIVESEPQPGQALEIARLARGIESLSDKEVDRMLQEHRVTRDYAR